MIHEQLKLVNFHISLTRAILKSLFTFHAGQNVNGLKPYKIVTPGLLLQLLYMEKFQVGKFSQLK